jgi:hypothetical protein
MRKFLKDMFTEKDNKTFDVTKALAALTIVTGIALAIVSVVWKNAPLNMQDYGTGMGLLFAGLGVALGMKKETNATE